MTMKGRQDFTPPEHPSAITCIVPQGMLELVGNMLHARNDGPFYALTLTASEDGEPDWHFNSQGVGLSPRRGFEIRQAREVGPNHWNTTGYPYLVVHDDVELSIFLLIGGHALVDVNVAKHHLSDVIEPSEVAPRIPIGGFVPTQELSRGAIARKTNSSLRKKVIKRDGGYCRICKNTPDTSKHVKLNVHHILPSMFGGLSVENNLLTLCQDCHIKLKPHYQPHLFGRLPNTTEDWPDYLKEHLQWLLEGVRLYQELATESWRLESW